jgi:hypothetical protein
MYLSCFREDFTYDNGSKSGPAVLRGVSGAIRKGSKKNGQWHGTATYTTQVRKTIYLTLFILHLKIQVERKP